MKNFLFFAVIFSMIAFSPALSFAEDSPYGLIPCDGGPTDPCGFEDAILLVDSLIDFLIFKLAIPIATVVIVWAGWIFLTKGNTPDSRKKAGGMMWNVIKGLALALAAWIIVEFSLEALGCSSCIQFLGGN